ncbi:retroviral-like aspartic protease family protein [Desulfofundulus thermobenzoicus]|uniref:retroviral-like aspartic protease family protein n=1 Tax=Desulfofundulus thermobenzoicus TaxID=29376 RepID=UPI00128F094B
MIIIPIRSSRHLVETYIQIYDAQRQATAYVALDTGAVFTVITPALARQIGLKDSLGALPVVSATGSQQANRYRVGCIQPGSEKITNLEVVVLNLPVQLKLDGLLGLNFLSRFITTFDYSAMEVRLQRLT